MFPVNLRQPALKLVFLVVILHALIDTHPRYITDIVLIGNVHSLCIPVKDTERAEVEAFYAGFLFLIGVAWLNPCKQTVDVVQLLGNKVREAKDFVHVLVLQLVRHYVEK